MGDFQPDPEIRDVGYTPPPGASTSVEVATIAAIREYGGRAEFRDTQRLMFELVLFIESGSTAHEVDFATYHLVPGDVLWVHSGQVQRWGEIDHIDGVICMFPPTLFDAPAADLIGRLGGWTRSHWPAAELLPPAADFGSLLADYRALHDVDGVDARAADAILERRTAATMLAVAASSRERSPGSAGPDDRLRRFRADVDRHCTTHRSVGFYADRLGLSDRSLHRLVSDGLGISPKKVIEARLVLEAKRYLVHGDTPVSSIARAVGFDDASNFAKFFRTATGMSPSAFRTANTGPRRE